MAEPSSPGEWPPRDLRVGPPPQPDQGKSKIPKAVIAIIVIGLLVLGGAAAAYFFVFQEKKTSEAEAAVEGFLKAMYAGDAEAAKSFATADAQELITGSASVISQLGIKYEVKEIKLKAVKESGNEAEVEIVDISLHASSGTFTQDMTLKQVTNLMGVKRIVYKLTKQNGKWLITGIQTT